MLGPLETLRFLEWHDATRALFEQHVSSTDKSPYPDRFKAVVCTLILNDMHVYTEFSGLPNVIEPIRLYEGVITQMRDKGISAFSIDGGEVDNFLTEISTACNFRTFIVIEEGYLGLAPRNAEVGDRIFIPMGSRVPFVIREKEGQTSTFELVRDAYVHGIMYGEATEKEDVHVEEILLC